MKRYVLTVSGHVQGVGFRYHVQRAAARIGLTGFVRNLDSGQVYIEVQGDEGKIDEFKQAITHDVPFATVNGIEAEETQIRLQEGSFRVKY